MITFGENTQPVEIDCYEGVILTIGKFCSIGSGLKIMSGNHPIVEHPECVSQFPFAEMYGSDYFRCKFDGEVTIGNDVWIATDVTILDGVTVGDGAVIGAKSVVVRDVPPYSFVAGNPAVLKKERFNYGQRKKLLEMKWWDWDFGKIKQAIPDMKDIETFLEKYGQS